MFAVLTWSLMPWVGRAAYVPDPAASPAWDLVPIWDQNGIEPPSGANLGNNDYDQLPNWMEDYLGTDRFNPDTDGDGITDSDEYLTTGTNPVDNDSNDNGWTDYEDWSGQSLVTADPDNDGANNEIEITSGSDVRNPDSDGDGLNDGLEYGTAGSFSPILADTDANGVNDYNQYYGIPPSSPPAQTVDSDGDGLSDDLEATYGASTSDSDSDDDGLNDGVEVAWGSSPALVDTDGDGAADATEHALGLLPNDADTDNDGLTDGFEITHNGGAAYQPNDADSNDDGYTDYQDYTGQTLPPQAMDGDGDGLFDDQEAIHRTSTSDSDSDDDGLTDGLEVSWGSSPVLTDTDSDEVDDALEYQLNLNPTNPDSDSDGLPDNYERTISLTHPALSDTDGDGLSDHHELVFSIPLTNPLEADTDHDFLTDFEEINASTALAGFNQPLNPTLADSDGDQVPDYIEVSAFLVDTDGGGIPDRIERFYGLNPVNPADDIGDLDGDSWTNLQEYQAGLSLNSGYSEAFDWDVDGMTNVWEQTHGLNPNDHHDAANDPDGDWSTNLQEFRNGSDPQVNDSGNSGTTGEGEPLVSEGDGSEWDADWDQDGTNNLDELLDDGTDPNEPDPDPCSCGGSVCGCSFSGECGSPCEPPPCICGGEICSCSQDGNCSSVCSESTPCTCGGSSCGCASSGSCSDPCGGLPSCACGGSACSCSAAGNCSSSCEPPESCSCGGDACSCSQAGYCGSICNSNESCSCGGSTCNCYSSGQCSSPCNPPQPCSCSQTANEMCSCTDEYGCSDGSCYTPPPCSCSWVGNGCSCATENECSGDCYQQGCGCSSLNRGCDCTPENMKCGGQTGDECMENIPCECSVHQANAQNCSCQEESECNDDCGPQPCSCEGVFFDTCECAFENECPRTNCTIPSFSVKATDNSGVAGNRTSLEELQMVRDPSTRTAAIRALLGDSRADGEPTWSGDGVTGDDGDLDAEWSGTNDSTPTASAEGTTSDVKISLFDVDRTSEDLETQSVDNLLGDGIVEWLAKFGFSATYSKAGNFRRDRWNADKWNDPNIGTSVELTGKGTYTISANDQVLSMEDITFFGVNFGSAEAHLSLDLTLDAEAKAYRKDVSKAPGPKIDGELKVTLGGKIHCKAQHERDIDIFGYKKIRLSSDDSVGPTLECGWNADGGSLTITPKLNDFTFAATIELTKENGQVSQAQMSWSPDWLEISHTYQVIGFRPMLDLEF